MKYHPVEYKRPTYFQLFIAYADITYCFANFKYAEGYVSIPCELNYYKYVQGLLMHMRTSYIHRGPPCNLNMSRFLFRSPSAFKCWRLKLEGRMIVIGTRF